MPITLPGTQHNHIAKLDDQFLLDDAGVSGDWVIKRGKIFRAGDYPDKNFHLTRDEMMNAIINFQSVPIDNEHRPSLFDRKGLGKLFHVEPGEDPDDMVGAIAIPSWVNEGIGDYPITVSTEWDTDSKTIKKLAFAIDPRVSDAAMFAAEAKFSKEHKKENTFMSWFNDLFNKLSPEEKAEARAAFSNDVVAQADPSTTQTPAPSPAPTPTTTTTTTTPSTPAAPAVPVAASFASSEELSTMRAQIAQFADERRTAQARDFVRSEFLEGRVLPFQADNATVLLSALTKVAESAPGTVKFSKEDGTTTDLPLDQAFKSYIQSQPKHAMFSDFGIHEAPKGSVLLSAAAASGSQDVAAEAKKQAEEWTKKNYAAQS